jgi:hypothetical protein
MEQRRAAFDRVMRAGLGDIEGSSTKRRATQHDRSACAYRLRSEAI